MEPDKKAIESSKAKGNSLALPTMARYLNYTGIQFLWSGKRPIKGSFTHDDGTIMNCDDSGLLHSEMDMPAIQCIDGHIEHWVHGRLGTTNGDPAVFSVAGIYVEYWYDGRRYFGSPPNIAAVGSLPLSAIDSFRVLNNERYKLHFDAEGLLSDGEYVFERAVFGLEQTKMFVKFRQGAVHGQKRPAVSFEKVRHLEYWDRGVLHRDLSAGPAVIHGTIGEMCVCEYWLNDELVEVREMEWKTAMRLR